MLSSPSESLGDFSPWLYCIAIVSFHVTKGHVVESIHPRDATSIPPEDVKAIAHFSLPDTAIDADGDVLYCFRFRNAAGDFSFGSVFFRQVRDPSLPRGYMQRSLVAITRRAEYLPVANEFVRVIAPLFFSYGADVVEVACGECRLWPAPGECDVALSVAGTEIAAQQYQSFGLFQDIPLFSTFGSLSVALWLLWELVLTGQQVLVLGPTPDRCSKAVLGICSLISPIPLAVDFRPFLTMFDSDFQSISNPTNKGAFIIGGTNPFLLRSLEHFPNVVSLGSQRSLSEKEEMHIARRSQTLRSLLRNRRWERSLVLTREESLVQRDESLISLLRRIGTDPKSTIADNNSRLRQAFLDLTKRFLEPLENFLRFRPIGERAAQGGIKVSAYHDDILREDFQFQKASFLAYIADPANRGKAFPVELYRRFLNGPNFAPWLERENEQLTAERSKIARTLIVETDVDTIVAMSSTVAHGLSTRVLTALNAELAKPQRDLELCARMDEHLNALERQQVRSSGIKE